jgi:hypothetical protein
MERAFIEFCRGTQAIIKIATGGVYSQKAPQSTVGPRLVVQEISSVPLVTMDGFGGARTSRLQIKSVAAKFDDAKRLARTVEMAANDFRGGFSPSLAKIRGSLPTGMRDLPPEKVGGSDETLYSVSQDWLVHWQQRGA